MIDELTSSNNEFTVDIIAAIGAAKKTPANQGGNTSIASSGITLSGTVIPGSTTRANTPVKCIPIIIVPTTIVPIINA